MLLAGVVWLSGCVSNGKAENAGASPTATPWPSPTVTVSPSPTATELPSPAGILKGVSLSPRSFEPADFTDFFQKAKQAGDIVSWAGDWQELASTTGGGPKVVAELASSYGYIPLIEAQFFTQSTGALLRSLDEATKQGYTNSAAGFAAKYKPRYLGLGIEVNMLYETSPQDFDAFAQLFSDISDAVKEASPDTKLFTVFQLERMKGLHGGLFGGTNDPSKAQWSLLDKFPKADLLAFTTYPGLVFKDPANIPSDYYTEIRLHTSRPIVFTEIGWHSQASPQGWESSDAEEAEFVAAFFRLTQGLDAEFAVWSFLYDQSTFEPFRSMGLLRRDGTAKPAWEAWLEAR